MAGANVETLAKALNLTPRRVQQLAGDGMPKAERGVYDIGVCMAWYIRYLQKIVEKRQDPDSKDDARELTRERSRLAKEQADKTALENAESRKDVARLSVVAAEIADVFSNIRTNVLALPRKLSPAMEGMNGKEREESLDRAVRECLEGLAAYQSKGRTRRRSDDDSSAAEVSATAAAADGQPVGRRKPSAKPRGKRRAGKVANRKG